MTKIQNSFVAPRLNVENSFSAPRSCEAPATTKPVPAEDGFVLPSRAGKTANQPSISGTPHLNYYGGGVLDHSEVTNMYIGDYFNTAAGQKDVAHNDAAVADLQTNKNFGSVLAQYGVGAGTVGQSQVLGGTYKSGQHITQAQIEGMLQQAVASGQVKPGAQSLYNFVLPPNAVLQTSDGSTSLKGVGGFHGSIHTPDGQTVYYSAIAYSKGSNGIDFTKGNAQDNISITESHEIAEADTDPNVEDAANSNDWSKLSWYDDQNGEIGDIEVNDAPPGTPLSTMYSREDGYAFQKIWSNVDGTNETKAKHPGDVQPLPTPATPPSN